MVNSSALAASRLTQRSSLFDAPLFVAPTPPIDRRVILMKLSIELFFVCSAHWKACDCVLAMGPQGTGRQKHCRNVANVAGNFGIYGQ